MDEMSGGGNPNHVSFEQVVLSAVVVFMLIRDGNMNVN